MTLREAIDRYVAWRRAHGAKFVSAEHTLYRFLKGIDEDIECDAVTGDQVRAYLAGKGPLTRYRAVKYSTLSAFYRFAVSRGYASTSPLPENEPKRPRPRPPYIYSREELRRLFGCIDASRAHVPQLDAQTFRTLLMLLYGAGLRGGEARALTVEDVDLSTAVLSVRHSKFYKSRLVPVGPRLAEQLKSYAVLRADRPCARGRASTFLANIDGTPLHKDTVYNAFMRLLQRAGIETADNCRRAPCLHGFRHSFAVHRLTDWYRQGADVQRLLPVLSTYLGHARLRHTQVYLSMTPELLRQAGLRFDRYTGGNRNE